MKRFTEQDSIYKNLETMKIHDLLKNINHEDQKVAKIVKQAMKDLKKKGMIINEANVPAFAAAVKPVYKSYSDKYGSSNIDAILNTK